MSSSMFSTVSSNPTKYRMFFNYDNDKKVYVLPVLPEKITVTVKGKSTSIDIDTFGEILHRGKRDAISISFSSFFPAKYGKNYCACLQKEFKTPATWHSWMQSLVNAANPCHFVLVGSPLSINMYADITSYTPYEEGGDVGTISYKIELKEHRTPSVTTYKKTTTSKTTTSSSGSRSSNSSKPTTYTVVSGDCLSTIATKLKKNYGISTTASKLYTKNKSVIEAAAKKHGKKSSNNGWWIYAGTKLTIP